jgi:hypothetical protein
MIAPRLNLAKPKTIVWEGRTWCSVHRDVCLSDRGGMVTRPCPMCADGGK